MTRLLPLLCGLPLLLPAQDEAQSSKELLRTALFEEEVNQDHEKAAVAYQKVTGRYDQERSFAGLAFFRLAEIARKSGDQKKATELYQRVVREFSDQEEISQRALAQLGDKAPIIAQLNLKLPITGEEAQELKRLKKIERESPDLLDGLGKDGWYPIHTAAANGWTTALAFLMERKVQIDPKTSRKVKSLEPRLTLGPSYTPLHLAVINGHLAVVNQLITAGADPELSVPLVPQEDLPLPTGTEIGLSRLLGPWRPLDLSIILKRKEIMTRLLKSQDELNRGSLKLRACRTFTKKGEGEQSWSFELTPLVLAIWMDDSQAMDEILAQGADLNPVLNEDGGTPLLAAIWNDSPLIPSLIKRGAKVTDQPIFGRTALHWALLKASTNHILTILEEDLDVNSRVVLNQSRDEGNRTPLEAILERQNSPIIRDGNISLDDREKICTVLIEKGARPTARALLKATAYGFTDIVASCLDSGLDPNESDKDGNVPLHFTDQLEIAKILVKAGARVNAKNAKGFTPLIMAIDQADTLESRALVDYLLNQGADSSEIPELVISHPEIGDSSLLPYLMSQTLLPGKSNPKTIKLAYPRFWEVTVGEDLVVPGTPPPSLREFLFTNLRTLTNNLNRRKRLRVKGRYTFRPSPVITDLVIYRPDQDGRLREIAQLDDQKNLQEPDPKLQWGDIILLREGNPEADKEQLPISGHLTRVEARTVTFKAGNSEHPVTIDKTHLEWYSLDLREHFLPSETPIDLTKITLRRANGESRTFDLTLTDGERPRKIRLMDGDTIEYVFREQPDPSGPPLTDVFSPDLRGTHVFFPDLPGKGRSWRIEENFPLSDKIHQFPLWGGRDFSNVRIRRIGKNGVEMIPLDLLAANRLLAESEDGKTKALELLKTEILPGDILIFPPKKGITWQLRNSIIEGTEHPEVGSLFKLVEPPAPTRVHPRGPR